MSPILTINEATTICRLSRATLYRIIGRGEEHPFIQVEGRWLVYEDELHDWIRSSVGRAQASQAWPTVAVSGTPRLRTLLNPPSNAAPGCGPGLAGAHALALCDLSLFGIRSEFPPPNN